MVEIETNNNTQSEIEIVVPVQTQTTLSTSPLYGPAGNGVSSITKTSTSGLRDNYTIAYTNGTTAGFYLDNGRGITSIQLTSSTSYSDTYTIYYNDNTTSTFSVVNDAQNVSIVGNNINSVNAVGSNITSVNTCASNITDITTAPTYATTAKQYAVGLPSEPSEKSAKYWAEQAMAHVQADWGQTVTTESSYIKNKPDLSVYVQNTRKINTKPLSSDVTLTASDVGACDTSLSNITTTGKTTVTGYAFPSSSYTDLTLGASGSTYTAPADGYVSLYPIFNTGGWVNLLIDNLIGITLDAKNQLYQQCFLPVRRGSTYQLLYANVASWTYAKFIYAEGEV